MVQFDLWQPAEKWHEAAVVKEKAEIKQRCGEKWRDNIIQKREGDIIHTLRTGQVSVLFIVRYSWWCCSENNYQLLINSYLALTSLLNTCFHCFAVTIGSCLSLLSSLSLSSLSLSSLSSLSFSLLSSSLSLSLLSSLSLSSI